MFPFPEKNPQIGQIRISFCSFVGGNENKIIFFWYLLNFNCYIKQPDYKLIVLFQSNIIVDNFHTTGPDPNFYHSSAIDSEGAGVARVPPDLGVKKGSEAWFLLIQPLHCI